VSEWGTACPAGAYKRLVYDALCCPMLVLAIARLSGHDLDQ